MQYPQSRDEIQKEVGEQLQLLKKEAETFDTQKGKLKFQSICIQLFNPALTKDRVHELLKQLLELIPSHSPEFKHDIEGFLASVKNQKEPFENKEGWIIIDTDDPCDLLLSGTEVIGSCQRIGGNSNNLGLLGTMLDGKYRMVAIKDPLSKKIIARALIRLLWDDKAKKAVLYQERIYPPTADNFTQMLIKKMSNMG